MTHDEIQAIAELPRSFYVTASPAQLHRMVMLLLREVHQRETARKPGPRDIW